MSSHLFPRLDSRESTGSGSIIRSKAPVRFSFAGGGTDFPHWYEEHGQGAVLCTTINHCARVTLYPREDNVIRIRSVDLGYMTNYNMGEPNFDGILDLAKATIARLGGERGMDLDIRSDAPSGTGLGGSSALVAATLGAVATYTGRVLSNYELARLNYTVERGDLNIPGGYQDQYATTFGGFNLIEFSKKGVLVNPLRIDPAVLNDLEAHLLLCYTGRVRVDQHLIDKQIRYYQENPASKTVSMQRIYDLVFEMKEALLTGNLHAFGELLSEGFQSKKQMNPDVTSGTQVDEMYAEAMRQGAVGGKLMGAGGGGYMLLYCETHRQHDVRTALEAMGGRFVNFSIEPHGLQVWRTRCP